MDLRPCVLPASHLPSLTNQRTMPTLPLPSTLSSPSLRGLVLAGLCCSPDSHLLSLACSRPVYRVKVQLHSLDFVFCFNHPLRTEEDRLFYPAGVLVNPSKHMLPVCCFSFCRPIQRFSPILPHFLVTFVMRPVPVQILSFLAS